MKTNIPLLFLFTRSFVHIRITATLTSVYVLKFTPNLLLLSVERPRRPSFPTPAKITYAWEASSCLMPPWTTQRFWLQVGLVGESGVMEGSGEEAFEGLSDLLKNCAHRWRKRCVHRMRQRTLRCHWMLLKPDISISCIRMCCISGKCLGTKGQIWKIQPEYIT